MQPKNNCPKLRTLLCMLITGSTLVLVFHPPASSQEDSKKQPAPAAKQTAPLPSRPPIGNSRALASTNSAENSAARGIVNTSAAPIDFARAPANSAANGVAAAQWLNNARNPSMPCCPITAINGTTGIVTAKVNATGQTFQFTLTNKTLYGQLRMGKAVYANLSAKTVSLDGRTAAGSIVSIAAAPATKPSACCAVTDISSNTGVVTANVNATGQAFQFTLSNAASFQQLRAGTPVYANFSAKTVSLDGKTAAGSIVNTSAAPIDFARGPGNSAKDSLAQVIPPNEARGTVSQIVPPDDARGSPAVPNAAGGTSLQPHSGSAPVDLIAAKGWLLFQTTSLTVTQVGNTYFTTPLQVASLQLQPIAQCSAGCPSGVQYRIYQTAGQGSFDTGILTFTSPVVKWTPPGVGQYQFTAIVDPKNKLNESIDERADNTETLTLTVAHPDLVELRGWWAYQNGEGLPIAATGSNSSLSLPLATTNLSVGLQNNTYPPTNSVPYRIYQTAGPGSFDSGILSAGAVGANGPGAQGVITPSPTITWTPPALGQYQFLALIDPNNQFGESPDQQGDNTETLTITVLPPQSAGGTPRPSLPPIDSSKKKGDSSVLGMPALTTTLPSTNNQAPAGRASLPPACCVITGIDSKSGVVTAKVDAAGQTFQFAAGSKTLSRLQVGQEIYANFKSNQVSLDGQHSAGTITTAGTPPLSPSTASQSVAQPSGGQAPSSGGTVTRKNSTPKAAGVEGANRGQLQAQFSRQIDPCSVASAAEFKSAAAAPLSIAFPITHQHDGDELTLYDPSLSNATCAPLHVWIEAKAQFKQTRGFPQFESTGHILFDSLVLGVIQSTVPANDPVTSASFRSASLCFTDIHVDDFNLKDIPNWYDDTTMRADINAHLVGKGKCTDISTPISAYLQTGGTIPPSDQAGAGSTQTTPAKAPGTKPGQHSAGQVISGNIASPSAASPRELSESERPYTDSGER
jgi:hypothetical protein